MEGARLWSLTKELDESGKLQQAGHDASSSLFLLQDNIPQVEGSAVGIFLSFQNSCFFRVFGPLAMWLVQSFGVPLSDHWAADNLSRSSVQASEAIPAALFSIRLPPLYLS